MAFKICLQFFLTDSDCVDDLSVNYSLHSEHASDKDSNSYIEETLRQTFNVNEHRERSLNKLTRTLGVPFTIMEDCQTPIFDNLTTADKLIGSTRRRTHHKWDSFESDSLSSPTGMTFAPPSIIENAPHSKQTTAPASSDADSNLTTTSREDHSTQSHCSLAAESSASSMPHVSTHSISDSVSNDDSDVVPPDPNGAVGQSDWLVPLNEVVISIRRTAPSKPQSWTGEWNREMKDVIRDLRRL
jgi:hypothetical protein